MIYFYTVRFKKIILCLIISILMFTFCFVGFVTFKGLSQVNSQENQNDTQPQDNTEKQDDSKLPEDEKKYIKWVDFNIPVTALKKSMDLDIKSHTSDNPDGVKYNWIELLAYLSTKYGGEFKKYKEKDINDLIKKLDHGETIENLTKKMKYYSYYKESLDAILSEFVGEYTVNVKSPESSNKSVPGPNESPSGSSNEAPPGLNGSASPKPGDGSDNEQSPSSDGSSSSITTETKYGLKVYSPIAKGYYYGDCDDFGNSRSYGYKRKHQGHDYMTNIGTPVIAVESGTIEEMGWNQYGGWRIGIRSFDKKRYYYYAHLRKDHPFHKSLQKGMTVDAGRVIGYVGRTGYSVNENVNNIQENHLHFGLQLIFDESQKDGVNQIWIDFYQLSRLLENSRSAVVKDPVTKDYNVVG